MLQPPLTTSAARLQPVILGVLVAKTVSCSLHTLVLLLLELIISRNVQVADALEPKGIYDLVIELNQIPFLDAKESQCVA